MPAAYAARAEEVAARRKEFLLRSSRYDILEVNDEFLNYLRMRIRPRRILAPYEANLLSKTSKIPSTSL